MKNRYGVNEWYDMMNEGVHREVALGPKCEEMTDDEHRKYFGWA